MDDIDDGNISEHLVSLLDARGGLRAGRTAPDGVVEFEGVQPGLTGVVVTGDDVHAAASIHLSEAGQGDSVFRVPVTDVDSKLVLRTVRSYLPPAPAAVMVEPDAEIEPATGAFDYEIILGPGGTLQGYAVVPGAIVDLSGLNVLLFRDGVQIDRTSTNPEGSFAFQQLQPGVYGVIVAGPAGYGAVAFEAVAAESLPAAQPVSLKTNTNLAANNLVVSLIPPSMFGQLLDVINEAYGNGGVAGDPFGPAALGPPGGPFGPGAGGGFGPGGGGVGGGLGGGGAGGGLGGLGGLAALGALGAALAASDDDDALPASPFIP